MEDDLEGKKEDSDDPGCKFDSGVLIPVINHNKCEAKDPCVAVCPYDVFEIRQLQPEERAALSFFGRMKSRVKGWNKAFAVRAGDCHGCAVF